MCSSDLLARASDPVRHLTRPDEGRGKDDLAGEQAMGGGRSEKPQQGVHQWAEQLAAVAIERRSKERSHLVPTSC